MLSLNKDSKFYSDKTLIRACGAKARAQIKYKGLDFPSVGKSGKTFYGRKQYEDKPREWGFQHTSVPELADCQYPADSHKTVRHHSYITRLSPFTVGTTLLGYHGLSSSVPRDAYCLLGLEINQCLTPPSSNGKARPPLPTPHDKPISLRKVPGYYK